MVGVRKSEVYCLGRNELYWGLGVFIVLVIVVGIVENVRMVGYLYRVWRNYVCFLGLIRMGIWFGFYLWRSNYGDC